VAPDLMAMAKGINSGYVPLGATLINERVASAFDKPGVPAVLMHGYTYTGHPLACAAANANLEIVEAENLPARSLEVGAYLLKRLGEFTRYPHVGDVRGMGLMVAIELVVDRETKEMLAAPAPYVQTLVAAARREGAIVRVQGNRLILSPPLVFSNADVDETARVLHAAFQAAERT
jgi:putrescine aminotransferase